MPTITLPWTELRAVVALTAMLTLPGWAALSLSGLWRDWKVLQRWIVATGVSIAFYPVLFYTVRATLPFVTLGPYKMLALLLAFAAVIVWRMRDHWREQFALETLEWIGVFVFGMTLFTRFWIIRNHGYPAWSDSLHHALLTRLTAVRGKLPAAMEPYFPVPLDQYHLGLYSLTGTVQWLTEVPAHTALLWTAQALNGLCGLGVYLVLDRKAGHVGAIVGAVTVGLLSHQPAFYVNWGRFTQLSAQTILLIAWVVAWEALAAWKRFRQERRARLLWQTGLAGLLTGSLVLLHFRVALFYLPLLAAGVLWELWKGYKEQQGSGIALGTAAVGLVSLLVAASALTEAISNYVSISLATATTSRAALPDDQVTRTVQQYYEFPWSTVPYLVADTRLLILGGVSAAIGLLKRNRLTIASLAWTLVLSLLGKAYLLSIPLLSITNLGAVLIMFYLPLGLIVGSATEEVRRMFGSYSRGPTYAAVVLALLSGVVMSRARIQDLEPYRFFVTTEDVEAMAWIRENTPQDALFAVNTYFWLPQAPHGTDAGYWIPYFTDRRITAGPMLISLGPTDYVRQIVQMSKAVENLEGGGGSIADLRRMNIDYVYVGKRGDFSGPGLDPDQLASRKHTQVVYDVGGVAILQIEPLAEAN